MTTAARLRVLVVDDSSVQRQVLSKLLSQDPAIHDRDTDIAGPAGVHDARIWIRRGRLVNAGSVDHVLFAEPGLHAREGQRTWRIGELETDARMLFCRATAERPIARLALVDGSTVRTVGRRGFQLALPRAVPDLHLDLTADARAAGPAVGASLVVGGREYEVAPDRRAMPRR